jgi:integrase
MNDGPEARKRREPGSGCLIPPRPGISRYWCAQVADVNGRKVRSSRMNSGQKVRGDLKPGCDPKLPESWTNITEARLLLKQLLERVSNGVTVGHDPTQLRYADLRRLYLDDYKEQGHKSLRKTKAGIEYVDCLPHLDTFMEYAQEGDRGLKVSNVTVKTRNEFVKQRQEVGAANGTINRSLAALRRMFTLAIDAEILKYAPKIKMLPESNARTGFLEMEDYNRLHAAFGVRTFAYVQPILQMGFYTGMRLGEILNLKWDRVDLKNKVIRLEDADVKNETGREIPLIDGLPETLRELREAHPNAEYVFVNSHGAQISSFRKAWEKITKEVGLEGLLFHDLRRTAVRNLVRAGVSRGVAMKISGHKNEDVFERYNVTDSKDIQNAAELVSEYHKRQRAASAPTEPAKSVEEAALEAVNRQAASCLSFFSFSNHARKSVM